MSHQEVKRFLSELESDSALQDEARAIDAADGEAAARALVRMGADRGYTFSAAELAEVLRESAGGAGELGEEQLERVAGGIGLLLPAVQKVRDGSVKLTTNITDGTSNTFYKI
ncbi:MAG TPA: Nif11-like leader peptide family RiPP precursor [Thermoanaerobaculia bacterium]|nr:Nif11-like leader peptide family RiPP precursor [Thermoanaerobaculia bacterium]